MSVFDEDAKMNNGIDSDCYNGQLEKRRDIVRNNYSFINKAGLPGEEFEKYCQNLSMVDAFCVTSIPGLPDVASIRNKVKVIFSDEERTYEGRYGLPDVLVLGEYNDYSKSIYIYVNNIKKVSHISYINRLMLAVYIHEMYHAYFESGNMYVKEIEEPLAEFGALFCLEVMAAMRVVSFGTLRYYKKRVELKKKKLPIYAFGSYIYKRHMQNGNWRLGEILKNYRDYVKNTKPTPIATGSVNEWGQAYDELCKTLNYMD